MSQKLLDNIRTGTPMTRNEKLRLIISMSIPSILAQISSVLMFFIDASMVGHIGAQASAAIGLVESTCWLFGGLVSAASMGFSVQVAHAIGASDFLRARNILRQALVCTFIYSTILCIIAIAIHNHLPYWLGGTPEIARNASLYFLVFAIGAPLFQLESLGGSMLKCSGNMKIPSILNIFMCILDVVLNYLFIYRLHLGVLGAALGTMLAYLATAILMSYFLLMRSGHLSIIKHREGSFLPTSQCVSQAFQIGAPMALQQVLMGGAQIVSTIIVAPLGIIAIAANTFAITVESICYMPGYGIAEAATTLVGQSVGAGQRLLTRSIARLSVSIGMTIMTFMGILMWVFAPQLMGVMTPVADIQLLGIDVLRIEAFAEPFFAAAIVCQGIFVGAGHTLTPAIINLSSMWAVRLTLAAFLAPIYGLRGVWTAMAVELTFRGTVFLARLFKKF